MTYLVIAVLVAAAGMGKLWVAHRRNRARLYSFGMQDSLARLTRSSVPVKRPSSRRPADRRPVGARRRTAAPRLDPERRAAAKRRIEARRRYMRARA